MIYERFILIFLGTTLSSLAICSHGWATKLEMREDNLVVHNTMAQAKIFNSQNEQQLELIEDQSEQQQPEAISEHWALVGIGLTSLLYSIMLWILLSDNSTAQAKEKAASASIDYQNELEKVDPEPSIQPKKPDFTATFSSVDAGSIAELSQKLAAQENKWKSTDKDDFYPNLTLAEDDHDTMLDPLLSRVNATEAGKVKIVSSDTTEIDLVFELIQDLKKSDRQIRRKAICELSQTGDFRGIEPLVKIMPHIDILDKSLVIEAISNIAQRNFQPINQALSDSVKNENSQARENANQDLSNLYESIYPIIMRLSQMLQDSDQEIQQTARWALQQFDRGFSSSSVQDHTKNGNQDFNLWET